MQQNTLKKFVEAFGPETRLSWVRWAPSNAATQTLTESHGVTSVTRSAAGTYSVNLKYNSKAIFAIAGYVEDDTTNYHFVDITATTATASSSTVGVKHRTVAYASVASGPGTGSDTVDEIIVLVLQPLKTVLRCGQKSGLYTRGPQHELAYVRWAPSNAATQTPLTEAVGVVSVTRSGAGVYAVNLNRTCKAMAAFVLPIFSDTTNYHWAEVTATSVTAKTVSIRHRTQAFASVASAPTASDTVAELQVLVLMKVST